MINEYYAKKFCCDNIALIENYNLAINDLSQTYACHHRLEIQNNKVMSKQELINLNLYYNRPASELIFLTKSEHHSLHMKGFSKSEEHRKKLSIAHKGSRHPHSPETILKMKHPHKKYNWLTPSGEIKIMCKEHVAKYHKDWILIA